MVEDFIVKTLDQLVGRIEGPFTFRFVLQPTVAVLLAARAEWKGAPAWTGLRRLCVVAFVLDAVYQELILDRFHPLQALLVMGGLAVVPYVIARAGVHAMLQWRRRAGGRPPLS